MKSVGAFDAKTHLNALLKEVEQGQTIRITRRGVPVAMLVPAENHTRPDLRKIGQHLRAVRKGTSLGKHTIRELIDEGRRF